MTPQGAAISRRYLGRAERLGWTPDRDARVAALYGQGLNNREIAEAAGVSPHSVVKIVNRLRLHQVIPHNRPGRAQ